MEKKKVKEPKLPVGLWRKAAPYIVALVLFAGFAMWYCSPLLEGKVLQAGDTMNWQGAAHEVQVYKETTGETSWWTNSMFGGMPTYQITGTLPSNKMRVLLERITHLGFAGDWNALGLIIGYLLGFFLMLRCFRVNAWLSIVGAFALTLSTYFLLIIPAGHITKAMAIGALAPFVGGVYAIYRKNYVLGIPMVLIYGFIGLTVHPQMTYYVALLIGVMVLTEIFVYAQEKDWKWLGINLGVLIVCALLVYGTKLSWFKMNNEYLAETMRGGHSELTQANGEEGMQKGLDIDYATAWSYGKQETLNLMVPNLMGGASGYNVGDKSVLYDELVKARVPKASAKQFCQSAPTYWGEKAFTSGPVYVGAIVCFLFVLGLLIVPGPYKWCLLIATLFSILLAWGRNLMPLTQWFYDYFPMYNKFRAVESILIVAEMTIPLLGFLGLERLMQAEDRTIFRKPICIAAGVTAGLCLVLALFGGTLFDFTSSYDAQWKSQVGNDIYGMIIDQRAAMLKADAWRSFVFIALAACVLAAYTWSEKLKASYVYVLLGVLIVADMVPVNRRFFGTQNFDTKKNTARYFAIQPWEEQILRDTEPDFRVLNVAANTFNDARTSYRLKSIGGYSAVKLRRYQDLIDAHISRNNMQVINMLNTKYVVTRDGVQRNGQAFGSVWLVDDVRYVDTPDEESEALWDMDLRRHAVADRQFEQALTGAGEASDTDVIEMTAYAPNKLDYTASLTQPRVAVFSEIYYPYDWHLYVDGEERPLARVNYMLRAAVIPAGKHSVHMEFRPSAVVTDRWSMALVVLLLIVSGVLLTYPLYQNRVSRVLHCGGKE